MENIEKFIDRKIENLNLVEGGKTVVPTYINGDPSNGLSDKYYYEDGCDQTYKVVTNPGIINWITGKRHVDTFPGCNHKSDYDVAESR